MSTEREPKPKHPIPWWGYLFAEVCGIIPLLTLGGAIPGAIGVGGAARCLAIARDPAKSVAILVGVCTGMRAVCWALFAVLRDSRIASQSKTARTGSIARSKHWKWGLIFELPARINQSTLTPRIMADIANKYPESVAGKFYVDNQCIDCDLCRETAPNNFKRNDDGGYSFVYKQPSSPEEEAQCKEAKEGCPVEAIGDNGDQA